jgi:DnaJ-class molecular chaperone
MRDPDEYDDDDFVGDDWESDEDRNCEECAGTGYREELLGQCPDCRGMGLKPEWW